MFAYKDWAVQGNNSLSSDWCALGERFIKYKSLNENMFTVQGHELDLARHS